MELPFARPLRSGAFYPDRRPALNRAPWGILATSPGATRLAATGWPIIGYRVRGDFGFAPGHRRPQHAVPGGN